MKALRSSYPESHLLNPAFRWTSPRQVDQVTPEQQESAIRMLQRVAEQQSAQFSKAECK